MIIAFDNNREGSGKSNYRKNFPDSQETLAIIRRVRVLKGIPFGSPFSKGGQGQIDFKVGSIKNFFFPRVPIIHLITRDHPWNRSSFHNKKEKENGRMNKIWHNALRPPIPIFFPSWFPLFLFLLSLSLSLLSFFPTSYVGKIDHWDGKHSWPIVV